MNNDRELLQQALEALEAMQSYAAAENKGLRICDEAIEALRARLSQCGRCGEVNPAEIHTCTPQPVGWIYEDDEGRMIFSQMPHPDPLWEPVYRLKATNDR
jgi:hypothetical protein